MGNCDFMLYGDWIIFFGGYMTEPQNPFRNVKYDESRTKWLKKAMKDLCKEMKELKGK